MRGRHDPHRGDPQPRRTASAWFPYRLVALLALLLLAAEPALPANGDEPFTIALLGDTQTYVTCTQRFGQNYIPLYSFFTEQTQWLADNSQALNLKLVIQVGDITDNGDYTETRLGTNCDLDQGPSYDMCRGVSPTWCEWHRAQQAMDTLKNAGIPYLITPGNHDDGDWSVYGRWEIFDQFFGASYYAGQPWFLGADTGVNYEHFVSALKVQASGRDWLVLSWEGDQLTPAMQNWLEGQIAAHPDVPTILSTHVSINGWQAIVNGPHRWFGCHLMEGWGFNDGQCSAAGRVFSVEPSMARFPQVFMVSAGHVSTGRAYHLKQRHPVGGQEVLGVLTDYSATTENSYWPVNYNGGGGLINLLTVDPARGEICMNVVTAAFGGPHNIDDPTAVWCESLDVPGFGTTPVPTLSIWGALAIAAAVLGLLWLQIEAAPSD